MHNKKLTIPFEVKEIDESGRFAGYGSVFDVVDSYKEVVTKGAFKKSLARHKKAGKLPKLLWQHYPDKLIGKYTAMKEDETGLWVEGQLYTDQIDCAREAFFLMKEGEIDGLSIGFMTKSSTYDREKGIRYLSEIDLWEVSVVTFPANIESRVLAAKAADHVNDIRSFKSFLRENGFSANAAKSIASTGFKPSSHLLDEGEETTETELRQAAVKAFAGEFDKLLTNLKGA